MWKNWEWVNERRLFSLFIFASQNAQTSYIYTTLVDDSNDKKKSKFLYFAEPIFIHINDARLFFILFVWIFFSNLMCLYMRSKYSFSSIFIVQYSIFSQRMMIQSLSMIIIILLCVRTWKLTRIVYGICMLDVWCKAIPNFQVSQIYWMIYTQSIPSQPIASHFILPQTHQLHKQYGWTFVQKSQSSHTAIKPNSNAIEIFLHIFLQLK